MGRFIIILAVFMLVAYSAAAIENPIEVGSVNWGRDLDGALKRSDETGRPVFVLFQEVPGCSGCQDFGRTVLTNPLLVEAIEDEFLPVLVFNNRGGTDQQLLDRYDEPSWNYQVVRFLNAKGQDIIPRKDRIWTTSGIAKRMIDALKATHRQVPKYLQTLAEENNDMTFLPEKPSAEWRALYAVPGLTKTQREKIGSARPFDRSRVLEWLSPRQRTALGAGLPEPAAVIRLLADNFRQLPEKQLSISEDGSLFAQYAEPTTRYTHGILGDAIEAKQLVVVRDGAVYTHTLADRYVFEDIAPRLFDVDNDGQLEVVTIRTHVNKGAGIMIYKIEDNALTEFAWVEEIGTPSRWLNIAAIYDLDGDGEVELSWIETPHIGGILKVARIRPGRLDVLTEASYYSNHSIGERNLCLSVVTQNENVTSLYVPTQNRREIVGFRLADGIIQKAETIPQPVNFSHPLTTQHPFNHVVQRGFSCLEP